MDTRYYLVWRNKSLTDEAEDIEDMISALEQATQTLRDMHEAGVWLEGGAAQDDAYLVTDNQDVAFEFGFEEEEEEDDDDDEYDEEEYDEEYDSEEYDSEYEGKDEGDYYGDDEAYDDEDYYEEHNDEDYN